MKRNRSLVLLAVTGLFSAQAGAASVALDYDLQSSVASIDPFSVPNPQGGADITVTPSITLDSGSFSASFANADNAGVISDGGASIFGVEFDGEIRVNLASTIEIFNFPVPVSADIAGPLSARQVTDSSGTLVGLSNYVETSPGDYEISAGPLECSDSVLGLFCTALETALGIEFPLDGIDLNSPLPFAAGTFSGLNEGSGSDVTSEIDFSIPITDALSFGVDLETVWLETGRSFVIPEPSSSALGLFAAIGFLIRRRR